MQNARGRDATIREAGRRHLPGALHSRQGVFESCIRPASPDPHCHESRAFAVPEGHPVNAPPDQYGVVGHPVAHSWSPFIHGIFARETGQSMVYRLYDFTPEEFRERVLEFFLGGGRGLNVTLPHKMAAAEVANELTPRAARAQAVNTLSLQADGRLLGDNTDGAGLVHDLCDNFNVVITRRRILIIGAGGASRGVLAPLLTLEPAELVIANRTEDRAQALAKEFGDLGTVSGVGFRYVSGGAFDVIINATSASL